MSCTSIAAPADRRTGTDRTAPDVDQMLTFTSQGYNDVGMSTARAVINLDLPGPTISRHLYGHFAEHLGRCIYGGFWVGEDSDDPERGRHPARRGARRCGRSRSRTCAGPAAASPTTTTGATGSARASSGPGWSTRHWGDVVEDNSFGTPRVPGPVRAARSRAVRQRQRRLRHRPGDGGVGRVPDPRRRLPDGLAPPGERPGRAVAGAVLRHRQRAVGLRRQHARGGVRRSGPAVRHLRPRTTAATRSTGSPPAPTTTTWPGPVR